MGGGSAGIGHAVAAELAGAGLRVVITGRHREALDAAVHRLRERTGGHVEALVHDIAAGSDGPDVSDMSAGPVSGLDAAAALLAEVGKRHSGPDVLVLNAGGPPPGRILDVTDEQWQRAFALLLLGPLRLARLALPRMAERGFGRVVFVTSTAVRQPQPDLAASVVLRSAVTAAAKLLSREFAAAGVTVNCVAPGPTATERRAEILTARSRASGASYAELEARDAAEVPAGRAGQPAEVAAAVAFLVSDAASYVNGTVLTVDGGRTETI